MQRYNQTAWLLVLFVSVIVLLPLVEVVRDWAEIYRLTSDADVTASQNSFDWIIWEDADDEIIAEYVFPKGPADQAGLKEGDQFYALEYQTFFNAEVLKSALSGVKPGQKLTYGVFRDGKFLQFEVTFTRYPTFLYPRSSALWRFSIWGFTVGAFLHLIGLFIVVPLALHNRRSRFPMWLILVSSLWIFGNLLRLFLVGILGPPEVGSTYDQVFQLLTLFGLVGWIAFPFLLLRKAMVDTGILKALRYRTLRFVSYAPPLLLGIGVWTTTILGNIGPITQEGMLVTILFYACCYITLAALLVLVHDFIRKREESSDSGWGRTGTGLVFAIALIAALSVGGIVPVFGAVSETIAGWLIVSAQLLSIAPVSLVSLSTLRYGKVDEVLTRTLTYLSVFGLIFITFVGGLSLLNPFLEATDAPSTVFAGIYLIILLALFERLARRVRLYASSFFSTERQRARKVLSEFQEQMLDILNVDTLVQETVGVAANAFQCRSAVLFLQSMGNESNWIKGSVHPEPPYLTERIFKVVWPYLQEDGRIWAKNSALNESHLIPEHSGVLHKHGAALAVPIRGDETPIGLLVLGVKRNRRAVYNLEDLNLLRSLSSQLALAVERLHLVEREKQLARQSAEAQLVALRAQINPHFLFNALNTVISLIDEHPDKAEATVEHLAAIFRHILQTGSKPYVCLVDEFTLVNHYLSIEQARFGDKLKVVKNLDPTLDHHPVPAFAIQTLVENAVKHGLEKQRGGGVLSLTSKRDTAGMVHITVADTGIGIPALFGPADQRAQENVFFGIGLNNVAARLERLYGMENLLCLESDPATGTTAHLLLPKNEAGAPAHDVPKVCAPLIEDHNVSE